jgi:1-phosphofructokinase/tagatose 6-phosphate kinase
VILTVTLNAALDRTLTVPSFAAGHRHRATEAIALPGGKGVNVARALKNLGEPVIATGLAGGRTGTTIIEELTAEGILNDFVRIREESRASTAVVDPMSGQQTEINEVGPAIAADEIAVLFDKIRYLSKGADMVVLAGSLPREVPEDLYATILRELRPAGIPAAVDAFGASLRALLAAEPAIVSPNRREAEEVVGYEFQDAADVAEGAEALSQMGAGVVVIHDVDGCVARFSDGRSGRTYRAFLEPVSDIVATVGSGDALLAGFVSAWLADPSPEPALRKAVACGAANTLRLGAGALDRDDVESFARRVEITELS